MKSPVLIVEASAGSGKTRILAQRYLELLFRLSCLGSPIPFQNILAITFSNKASREMKERILDFLKMISLDRYPKGVDRDTFLTELSVDKKSARKDAQRAIDELFRHYNFFQVATIDSFINTLLSGCSFYLGLSANFHIEKDPREYLAYALDRLIDRAASDKKVYQLFQKFLKQYLYLENRAGWLPKNEIEERIARFFSIHNKYRWDFAPILIKPEELARQKGEILESLKKLREVLPDGVHATFEKKLDAFLGANKDGFETDDLSTYFRRPELPVKKGVLVSSAAERLWQEIVSQIRKLVEAESQAVFYYYIDIFKAVHKELKALSGENDMLFLDELNRQAFRLFDEAFITVPELYYRLSSRLRHFLIDEFQDTSVLQWENISPLVNEALSCGGSLFYVGDKKQAIYRFRGGEPLLFDKLKTKLQAFAPESKLLQKNYRSQRAIVEFCNGVFSPKNLHRFLLNSEESSFDEHILNDEDINEVLHIFNGAEESYGEENIFGLVSVKPLVFENKEDKDELIQGELLSLIGDLRFRFGNYKDIAILARENEEVETLTSWLLTANIPVASEKTLNIRNSSYIKELISLLLFLNSPIDDMAFASFILGDIFLESSCLDKGLVRKFIFDFRIKRRNNKAVYLYREFRKAFPQAWDDHLDEFFKSVGFTPLYEFLISIIGHFDCLNRFNEAQGFFMKLLELVHEHEKKESCDLASFLEYFQKAFDEDLYVAVAEPDAIRIMTIHKAKGLEFGAVVIPALEFVIKVPSQVTEVADEKLVFLRLTEKARMFSPYLEAFYRYEYRKALIDELNTAYVAITRAKEELYIFIPQQAGKRNSLVNILLDGVMGTHGAARGFEKIDLKQSKQSVISPCVYEDWVKRLKDEFSGTASLGNRRQRLRGDLVHQVLSLVGNLQGRDVERVLAPIFEELRRDSADAAEVSDIEKAVRVLLSHEKCRQFFYVADGDVYQEKEIICPDGATKRIDRLVVKDREAWVIDFKSSRDTSGKYREQLQHYQRILNNIYPEKAIRGFLIYLDTMDVEELTPPSARCH